MPCTPLKLGDGITALVCTRGRRRRCVHCGGPASQLCDFRVARGGKPATCDVPLCRHCSTRIPGDRDLCRPHAAQWDRATNRPKVGPGAAGPDGEPAA